MSSSAYWKSQLDYYKSNQPPKMESYYNQSFVDKMNEARTNIDNLVAEKDKSYAATGQAQDDYKAFQGTMSSYGEVYEQSKSEFGVEQHYDTYEKSKKALALAESTLSALPSTINTSSNRVLTQQQREERFNVLSDRFMRNRDNMAKQVSQYENVWKQARENQSTYAKAEMASQWSKLGDFNTAWMKSLEEYTEAEKRLTEGRTELRRWESDYRNWQYNQWKYANDIWLRNYEAALDRYSQALDTELAIRKAQSDMEFANRYGVKDFDFGGGYTMRGVSGQNAQYYLNGNSISAGRFLEGTGANGVNWNKWNEVWNSGVKTKGVGSDTVNAFNRMSGGNQYAYLFR